MSLHETPITEPSLVTFGETMLRLSPPAGTRLEMAHELEFRTAGAESNVAVAASNLGTRSVWLSKLPESPLGRKVVRDLKQQGVHPGVAWSEDGELRQGTYYLEHGTAPRGTDVIYDRADAAITTATADELALEQIENADVFFTSGITPALSDTLEETTTELLERARAADTTTAFDCNYRSKLWSPSTARETYEELFDQIDFLFVPERDARDVLDLDGDAESIGSQLRDAHDCSTVVVTRGDEGALAVADGRTVEQPVFEAETVDPIGTGDAFVGGFLSEWIDEASLEDALAYGAATAALKRTLEGDYVTVTPDEVTSVLEQGSGGIDR